MPSNSPAFLGSRVGLAAAAAIILLALALMTACGSGSTSSPTATAAPSIGPTVSASSAATTAAATTAPPSATTGALSETCPPASVVNSALGQSGTGPQSSSDQFGLTCTYPGSGPVPTKIQFQTDTAATFAAGEAAVSSPTNVSGLGDAAYYVSGFIDVLKGSVAVKIVSAFSTTDQLEALAHQIVG